MTLSSSHNQGHKLPGKWVRRSRTSRNQPSGNTQPVKSQKTLPIHRDLPLLMPQMQIRRVVCNKGRRRKKIKKERKKERKKKMKIRGFTNKIHFPPQRLGPRTPQPATFTALCPLGAFPAERNPPPALTCYIPELQPDQVLAVPVDDFKCKIHPDGGPVVL